MWFCTYCHLCSIKTLRMMFRVVSLYILRKKRNPLFLFLACWAKMCVNWEMIPGTFTHLREEHCRSWLRETSSELFLNIWTKTRARSASLINKGSGGQSKYVTYTDFVLYLAVLLGEAEPVWTPFAAIALQLGSLQLQFERRRKAAASQCFMGSVDAQ